MGKPNSQTNQKLLLIKIEEEEEDSFNNGYTNPFGDGGDGSDW
jgi:hypothetical protein